MRFDNWRNAHQHSSFDELLDAIHRQEARIESKSGFVLLRVEPVFIQLSFQDQVLVHEECVLERRVAPKMKFLIAMRRPHESAYMAAFNEIKQTLQVSFDASQVVHQVERYSFMEQILENLEFPTLPTVYKTHFVYFEILDYGPFEYCGLPYFEPFSVQSSSRKGEEVFDHFFWCSVREAYEKGVSKFSPNETVPMMARNIDRRKLIHQWDDTVDTGAGAVTLHETAHSGNFPLLAFMLDFCIPIDEVDDIGETAP